MAKNNSISNKLAEGFAELEAKNIEYDRKLEAFNVEKEEFDKYKIQANININKQKSELDAERDDIAYENSKLEAKRNEIASEMSLNRSRIDEAKLIEGKAAKDLEVAKKAISEANETSKRIAKESDAVDNKIVNLNIERERVNKRLDELRELEAKEKDLVKRIRYIDRKELEIKNEQVKLSKIKEESKGLKDSLEVKEKELAAFEKSLKKQEAEFSKRQKQYEKAIKDSK